MMYTFNALYIKNLELFNVLNCVQIYFEKAVNKTFLKNILSVVLKPILWLESKVYSHLLDKQLTGRAYNLLR